MNRIEGPTAQESPDFDPQLSKKKIKDVVSSVLKNEVGDNTNGTKEHLGHVIVTKESNEKKSVTSKEKLTGLSLAKIDTMNRAELISLSGQVEIDGTNLRKIFETKLIGENGLRRLIKEYISGGDLKNVLRQEILEREMDFERDPVMRDMAIMGHEDHTQAETDNTPSLSELEKKAAASLGADSEEVAFYKAKADFEVAQMHRQNKTLRRIDYVMAAVIVLLILIILAIFITRG